VVFSIQEGQLEGSGEALQEEGVVTASENLEPDWEASDQSCCTERPCLLQIHCAEFSWIESPDKRVVVGVNL
jgi:hypothetical protein